MTPSLLLGHKQSWTESEYLAIGETPERIELFDGSLHVSPDPLPRHHYVAVELTASLRPAVRRAGLHVLGGETYVSGQAASAFPT